MKLKNHTDLSHCEAVILDMDGVLADTEPIHVESFRIFLKKLNISYTEEFIDSLVGYSTDHNIQTINSAFLADNPLEISAGTRQRDQIYLSMINERSLTPMEGVEDLLAVCKRKGMKVALASSSVREQVDAILNNLADNSSSHLDYRCIFDVTVSGDDVTRKKPAPDIYERVLKLLNISAENCITIEDSEAGILSAGANRIYCFALKNKYLKPAQMERADRIISSIREVAEEIS